MARCYNISNIYAVLLGGVSAAAASDLQHSLAESSLDGEFLEVLGVWVVVECKVGFYESSLDC